MSSVVEIESAIKSLPQQDRWTLLSRFDRDLWSEWDAQIEHDQQHGALASLVAEARADVKAGRTHPLNEVLRHD